MIELPNRDDVIYKEIEAFEDYEFTNCIAYEMAIRNKEVKKILSKILLCQYKESNKIDIKKELHEKFFIDSSIIDYVSEKITFIVLRESYIKEIDTDKTKYYFISELIDKLEFIYEYYYNNELLDDYNHIPLQEHKYHNNSRHPLLNKVLNYKVNQKTPYTIVEIPLFKRPKVYPPDNINYDIDLKVNFNLPKDELKAYIEKIKDEFDKDNSIIKTPLELLGGDFEKSSNKKINKKLIVDKFFIYDYVTAMKKEVEESNNLKYNEYEQEFHIIKNNPYLNSNDRNIQLKELKKEFEENVNSRIEELFADIEDFTPATAKRYYYDIKPFIDDCKYKELITGIKL